MAAWLQRRRADGVAMHMIKEQQIKTLLTCCLYVCAALSPYTIIMYKLLNWIKAECIILWRTFAFVHTVWCLDMPSPHSPVAYERAQRTQTHTRRNKMLCIRSCVSALISFDYYLINQCGQCRWCVLLWFADFEKLKSLYCIISTSERITEKIENAHTHTHHSIILHQTLRIQLNIAILTN